MLELERSLSSFHFSTSALALLIALGSVGCDDTTTDSASDAAADAVIDGGEDDANVDGSDDDAGIECPAVDDPDLGAVELTGQYVDLISEDDVTFEGQSFGATATRGPDGFFQVRIAVDANGCYPNPVGCTYYVQDWEFRIRSLASELGTYPAVAANFGDVTTGEWDSSLSDEAIAVNFQSLDYYCESDGTNPVDGTIEIVALSDEEITLNLDITVNGSAIAGTVRAPVCADNYCGQVDYNDLWDDTDCCDEP